MKNDISELLREVVASPLGDVIASVGEGVADAQQALDDGSLAKSLEIYSEGGEEALRVLREIGYRPTFYALPETTGEVRVSMRLGKSAAGAGARRPAANALQPAVVAQLARIGRNVAFKPKIYATPVDASYANRFGYQANISAKLTFKIVPVPAPDGVDDLRVLPDFRDKTITDSLELAASIGLDLRVLDATGLLLDNPDGAAIVGQQDPSPEPPRFTQVGDEIVLTVK